MTDALFHFALILCAVSGVFCLGCIFSSVFAWFASHKPMATRIRRGKHYQGDTDQLGGWNGPW